MAKSKESVIYENLENLEKWALSGIPKKEMAETLGMAYSTFRDLEKKIPALSALLKECAEKIKKQNDAKVKEVETSVFKRATGYDMKIQKPIKVKKSGYDERGKKWEEEDVIYSEETVHIPADYSFARLFLTNKAGKAWKDNPHRIQNDTERLRIFKKQADRELNGDSKGMSLEEYLDKLDKGEEF